jgi:hypothetical protein
LIGWSETDGAAGRLFTDSGYVLRHTLKFLRRGET